VSEISDEWRSKPLDEVAAAAIENTMQAHVRAGIELQRRTIESLDRASTESARASRRLLVATWVLIAVTVVLVVLTVAIIKGD
jgi:hypothetical protein